MLAVAIALGAFPVARRITRRLQRLQSRVEALGAGDLSTRVEIEGKDEVAELALSFNNAADRIAHLVTAQQQVLAGVSHEIRTPPSPACGSVWSY
ncbi:MAG: HAMP domain-containing protein [Congregibacter sp.]